MAAKQLKDTIHAKGLAIAIYTEDFQNEYISLTDIARYKNDDPFIVINNWMREKDTIQFIGLWEQLHNEYFKPIEFDRFKKEAGFNAFTLSPQKWIEATNAIGIISKSGRNGGTFAHSDIAFEFASWVSPEFKLHIIKDYKRLKNEENNRLSLNWNLNRTLSKIHYRIHTDAIKENIIPKSITKEQATIIYAHEADVLNMALFGVTVKEWRTQNKQLKGNISDQATIKQLLVLANLEGLNAEFIKMGLPQNERLIKLNQTAISQLTSLLRNNTIKQIKQTDRKWRSYPQ